jgi:hypothetical protein
LTEAAGLPDGIFASKKIWYLFNALRQKIWAYIMAILVFLDRLCSTLWPFGIFWFVFLRRIWQPWESDEFVGWQKKCRGGGYVDKMKGM